MDIVAKDFTYNTGVVSRKAYDDHITLYKGYIQKTNQTTEILATDPELALANSTASHYRGWKDGQGYAINGVILHELYFQNMGGAGGPPGPKMQAIFNRFFGGYDKWLADFTACATCARGWCLLVYEQRTGSCVNIMLDSHKDGNVATAYPLIALDMYEHAYFIDYATDKAAYIARFISSIAWDIVEKRAALLPGI